MDYYRTKENRIICLLCRHYCTLSEGQIGMCHVEKNSSGRLECLVHNHPSTVHIDPIEKKPLYHFLPSSRTFSVGTLGCNLRCPFCQNWHISQNSQIDTSITLTALDAVTFAHQQGCSSVSYTYNEPAVWYPYAKEIGMAAQKKGLKNIFVSSGFESDEVCIDAPSWIHAINIDLKSFREDYYKNILKGSLSGVKETLKSMVKNNIWVEVTTLIVPGHNDSDEELSEMASFIANELGVHVPWHLSAFHPDYKMNNHPPTPVETLHKGYRIGKKAGLHYVYLGNVPLPTQTRCPQCDTLLIERQGFHVTQFHLDEDKCPRCRRIIEGVWK